MKINNINNNNNINIRNEQNKKSVPQFKGASALGILNTSGNIMQGIENQGYWLQFICQDVLGMTLPRVYAGFNRDREVTGHLNYQEGIEVAGREGLTGPSMMLMVPISFGVASIFGHSTSVNTRLIKRFGNNLKEILSNKHFDKNLLQKPKEFKEEFYKMNIEQILKNSLGEGNYAPKDADEILNELQKYESRKKKSWLKQLFSKNKEKSNCINNISEKIDSLRYKSSNELNNLRKVSLGAGDDAKIFSTAEVIDGMLRYGDDAISFNKLLSNLTTDAAENIKNCSIAKRMFANIGTMASVLGILAILPKIYARSNIAPGNATAKEIAGTGVNEDTKINTATDEINNNKKNIDERLNTKTAINSKDSQNHNNENNGVSFKGKGASDSVLNKIGEWISNNFTEKFGSEFEFQGHNFTPSLMAGLSVFGLLAPRGYRAVSRAQKNEDGKKDLSELYEIILRDLTSSLAVVFAVPMLTRLAVTSYEKNSGYVLMKKDRNMSKKQKILDLLNPYSKSHVMTNDELSSLYDKIDSVEKMKNFCEYINENDGNLAKILSKSELAEEFFKEANLDLKNTKGKKAKNEKIINYIKNDLADKYKNSPEELNNKLKNLMKKTTGKNKILSFARGLNSIPGLLMMLVISPILLGYVIPNITYANTRRYHEKQQKQKEQNEQVNKIV